MSDTPPMANTGPSVTAKVARITASTTNIANSCLDVEPRLRSKAMSADCASINSPASVEV